MQALAHHREQGGNYDVERLLRGASAAATEMLVALAWYYPELRPADEGKWNFLATAAELHLASRTTELTSTDQRRLPDHLAKAMGSCRRFISRAARDETDPLALDWAVGSWVLSGLFRQEPRMDQAWLAAAIGETIRKTTPALITLARRETSMPKRTRWRSLQTAGRRPRAAGW